MALMTLSYLLRYDKEFESENTELMNNRFFEKPNIPYPLNLLQCIIILNKYVFIWYFGQRQG